MAAAVTAAVLLLAGCSGTGRAGGSSSGGAATGAASASPSPAAPQLAVVGGTVVPYTAPVTLRVTGGTLAAVQVTEQSGPAAGSSSGSSSGVAASSAEASAAASSGSPAAGASPSPAAQRVLDGTVSGDGTSWTSADPPLPGRTYAVSATLTDTVAQPVAATLTFTVAAVPDDKRISFTVTPNDGTTVGIGQPIVVRFASPMTKRAALEKVMTVAARTPDGATVEGSWHWLSDSEVHWRPKEFWTPGTTVSLDMRITGVQGSATRTGRRDYRQSFTIGASHVTQVDATAHTAQVYRDGVLVDTWKAGTGRPGLETYSGTYVVLGKDAAIQMDSCSARITCDKKDPDYYDEKEFWATRITASGTFLHAASWDGQLGRANVSHGCIHLSDADAKTFYDNAVIGDVVIVKNTGRGPQERIATQDPGLIDWNLSWDRWTAGSAL